MRHMPVMRRRWAKAFLSEPHETFLAAAALFSGLAVLASATRPGSLATHLSPWVLHIWGASLSAGGVLTLASRWLLAGAPTIRHLIRGLRLEQLAMSLFATTAGIYAIAIMSVGRPGLAAGPIIVGWSAACTVRAWIIREERRALPEAG